VATKLKLSLATGNYDRSQPLADGRVKIDGVEPIVQLLSPEEMFFRSFRDQAFDISELSLSSFAVKTAAGNNPYVGVPVFPSRAFRHTAICIRTDRGINRPEDLKGRRIGTPEWQLTACVWARSILEHEYGVKPSDITWVRGGLEEVGRPEKISLKLPDAIKIEAAPTDKTLNQMLRDGGIDAIIAPRAPSCFENWDTNVGWLWADPQKAASEYYAKTKIFPIMHMIGIRKELVEEHPFLPMAVYKAFVEAKQMTLDLLVDTSASKVVLPFMDEALRNARKLMGEDFWPYGLEPNRHVLESFLKFHHEQGLSSRVLKPEELFHPSTLESFKI
jgi:4,5-dihydroxyphthalate decarboxylase